MTQTLSTLGSDAPDASALSEAQLLDVYRTMRSIRAFEDRVHEEFATGDIPGFVHLYAGKRRRPRVCAPTSIRTATPSLPPTAVTGTASPRASTSSR